MKTLIRLWECKAFSVRISFDAFMQALYGPGIQTRCSQGEGAVNGVILALGC